MGRVGSSSMWQRRYRDHTTKIGLAASTCFKKNLKVGVARGAARQKSRRLRQDAGAKRCLTSLNEGDEEWRLAHTPSKKKDQKNNFDVIKKVWSWKASKFTKKGKTSIKPCIRGKGST